MFSLKGRFSHDIPSAAETRCPGQFFTRPRAPTQRADVADHFIKLLYYSSGPCGGHRCPFSETIFYRDICRRGSRPLRSLRPVPRTLFPWTVPFTTLSPRNAPTYPHTAESDIFSTRLSYTTRVGNVGPLGYSKEEGTSVQWCFDIFLCTYAFALLYWRIILFGFFIGRVCKGRFKVNERKMIGLEYCWKLNLNSSRICESNEAFHVGVQFTGCWR